MEFIYYNRRLKEVVSSFISYYLIVSMVKVIIGGGDGTVMHVIEKLNDSVIDIKKCIFGVFPLGNSNDLSSALGWGGIFTLELDR